VGGEGRWATPRLLGRLRRHGKARPVRRVLCCIGLILCKRVLCAGGQWRRLRSLDRRRHRRHSAARCGRVCVRAHAGEIEIEIGPVALLVLPIACCYKYAAHAGAAAARSVGVAGADGRAVRAGRGRRAGAAAGAARAAGGRQPGGGPRGQRVWSQRQKRRRLMQYGSCLEEIVLVALVGPEGQPRE
jgi:hypothetical protein